MKKLLGYILISIAAVVVIYGCTKTAQPVISVQIDQAFIQDIIVSDTAGKDVTLTKTFPKPVADAVTGVEGIGAAQANPIAVAVKVKAGTDLTRLNVRFTLSGQSKLAVVNPVLGYIRDCTNTVQYTITSLTGKNKNVYAVQVGF